MIRIRGAHIGMTMRETTLGRSIKNSTAIRSRSFILSSHGLVIGFVLITLIHEVGHLLRDHEGRKKAAGITDHRRWNTAGGPDGTDPASGCARAGTLSPPASFVVGVDVEGAAPGAPRAVRR